MWCSPEEVGARSREEVESFAELVVVSSVQLEGRSQALVGEFLAVAVLRWIPCQLLRENRAQSFHSNAADFLPEFASVHFRV